MLPPMVEMLRFLKSICWWHRYVQFTKTHPREPFSVGTSHFMTHEDLYVLLSHISKVSSHHPLPHTGLLLDHTKQFPTEFPPPPLKGWIFTPQRLISETPLVHSSSIISLHSPVYFSVPSPPPEIISLGYICSCFQQSPLPACMLHENGDHIHRIHLCVPRTAPYT